MSGRRPSSINRAQRLVPHNQRFWLPQAVKRRTDGPITQTMLSPEVLASHQATLELQARDEDRLAPPSEALTALEEELVARHQRELAIAAERDRLRRELAGVGRERLDELRKAQSEDLARLDRETAARAAERAALAEEVAALERAAHVEEEPMATARSARSPSVCLLYTSPSPRD